jgi:hypothetical protein
MQAAAAMKRGTPRTVTPSVRAELGLPALVVSRYPWAFASLLVALACVPLMMASMWTSSLLAAAVGLVILPGFRWFEHREAAWREDIYRHGIETSGRVLDVEPAGSGRTDHTLRIEFGVRGETVRASVVGCPLARRGLVPDDEVMIVYDEARPTRCLVVSRITREVVDAAFDDPL